MERSQTANPPVESAFETGEEHARARDEADPLARYRAQFHVPLGRDGQPVIYFCGNSLGLMPKRARVLVEQELDDWAELGVEAHLKGRRPWFSYHEFFAESGARLVGALPGEVVMMNSLTVNIHLMMVTFFQPTPKRHKVLIESPAFPSDLYALQTHLRTRGLDPREALLRVEPRPGEHVIRTEDVESMLSRRGGEIALVWLPGVNFFTGQVFDMARITAAAKRAGCTVGFDLAHAAGNVPMSLHDWGVDFACWCSYKYLNGGPGAAGGCFVHEERSRDLDLPRFAGWWGDDPATRFQMHLKTQFVPQAGAAGWQVSNPPILSMAPLRASLDLFDDAGMEALRRKSVLLTGYLRWLLEQAPGRRFHIITPAEPAAQGCQLSILARSDPKRLHQALLAQNVACDFREPNVIRAAPAPFYNTFHEIWRFSRILLDSA